MRQNKFYLLLFCMAVYTGLFFSCSNDEEAGGYPGNVPLETDAEFLRLSDNDTNVAATLTVLSNAPEVSLRWATTADCNIDTTTTTLKVKGGKAVLPVRWMNKLADGKRGPEGVAYKAGVEITAGEYSKYVPLVWAQEVDSTKVMESVLTRAGGDTRQTGQITMDPVTVNMDPVNGGEMSLTLTGVPYALMDFSEFSSALNIDMSAMPNMITGNTVLSFRWKSGGAPSSAFSVRVVAMSSGLVQTGYVNYSPDGKPSLEYVSSNLPAGKIPYAGATYTFEFRGTYTGDLKLRASAGGKMIAEGAAVTNFRPSVTVPIHTGIVPREITFQYKRNDDNWTELPATTSRMQSHPADGIVCAGYTWATGNLRKVGSTYKFQERQESYSGLWNGGDYWRWNELDPLIWNNENLSIYWKTERDPCRQVAPAGTWRTPTRDELHSLINTTNSWGTLNGVKGRFFGTDKELFLPAAGYRPKDKSIRGATELGFYWGSSQDNYNGNAYMLAFKAEQARVDNQAHRGNASQIRCISSK